MKNIIIKNRDVSIIRISPNDKNYFTGYFDYCPFSKDNNLLICHKINNLFEYPSINNSCDIGFFDTKKKIFKHISKTNAWNFQFGARPHWVTLNSDECIMFNNYDDMDIKTYICDKNGELIKKLDNSIFTWHDLKQYGLTLNFKRLQKYRKGYGYNIHKESIQSDDIKNDGIFYFDFQKYELILSLEKIMEFERTEISLDNINHWVNHIQINPSGNKFAFMHRFIDKNNSFSTRLMLYCLETKNLSCIYDNLYCSHYTWTDDENILAWCRKSNSTNLLKKNKKFSSLRSLLRKTVGKNRLLRDSFLKDSFYNININYPKVLNKFFSLKNLSDGHINCFPNGNKIILDEYADINKYQPLSIYDNKAHKLINLISAKAEPNDIPTNLNYTQSEFRCDFHANWSRNDNIIAFDSTHEGYRGVYLINL